MYSLLWPLAEINDVGLEIRPFIYVDNYEQEYRILTGGWNSKKESNYILPLYVKNKKGFCSFPYSTIKDGKFRIDNYMLFGGITQGTIPPISLLFYGFILQEIT